MLLKKYFFIVLILLINTSWGQNITNNYSDTLFRDSTKLLKTVIVQGKKKIFERKVDRYVFNVENSIVSQGGDAIDALKNTPGVKVQSDAISIVGKGEVSILLDDRIVYLKGEDLAAFLHSISANDIKSIEVITNPPSKYDAQGNAGLINIIIKKGRLNSWSNSFRSAIYQNKYSAFTAGDSYNYNKNKISLGTSFDFKKGSEYSLTNSDIYYPKQSWIGTSNSKNNLDFISSRVSLDYQLNQRKNIGLQYIGNVEFPDTKDTTINRVYESQVFNTGITTTGLNKKLVSNNSLNLHYNALLDTLGKKMSIDFDYFNYNDNQSRKYQTITLDNINITKLIENFQNSSLQKINNYSGRIDFVHPSKFGLFTYGIKAFYTNSKNNYDFFKIIGENQINDTNQSNIFYYSENTQAIYSDFLKEFNQKIQFKCGLRIENTIINAKSITYNTDYKYSYTKFFPTLFLVYKPKEIHAFNFSYDRRINRPSFWELNPFRWYMNQYSYAVGNPYLKPSFTNNFELSYMYKENFITSISTSFTESGFGQIPIMDQNTFQQIYTRLNYYNSKTFGITQIIILNKFSWWKSMNQISLFYVDSKSNQIEINYKAYNGVNGNISSSNSFYLNKNRTLSSELNLSYTPQIRNILQLIKPLFSFDIGIKYNLNRYQFAVYINDMFKNSALRYTMSTNNIEQSNYQYNSTRFIRFSLKYTFGNKNIVKDESENINSEIKNRTNKKQ